ncbi:ABC transporter permease subunit [uncultured Ruegeria sp.]|uniref:ABC transporter permease n=1 Tax=uncultured Ruegeria sp. TaxID=259304 RepID=UPI0026243AAA|nr:ABC transporter permease subunit [uncultured Ruegeria sp.]
MNLRWLRRLFIAIPFFWMLLFFLVPFAFVLKISLSDAARARPPFTPQLGLEDGWSGLIDRLRQFDLESYVWISGDSLYVTSILNSLKIASVSTLLCLVFGYFVAYGMVRAPRRWRTPMLLALILPFWTSFLIRIYAWIGILKNEGFLNNLLLGLGVIDEPLIIMNTTTAVYIGIVYSYSTLMIFPLYASLERMDGTLLEAAEDLGCSRLSAFWQITFPLSLPGILAGCFLVFIPAMGEFVIPDILGGTQTVMIGKTMWIEFFSNRDWPVASALAILLLLILIGPILLFQRHHERHLGKI